MNNHKSFDINRLSGYVGAQNFAPLSLISGQYNLIGDGIIDIDGMNIIHGTIVETQNFASLPNNPGKPDMIDDGNVVGMIDIGGMIAIHGMFVETQNFASLPNNPGIPDMIDDGNMIEQTQKFSSKQIIFHIILCIFGNRISIQITNQFIHY